MWILAGIIRIKYISLIVTYLNSVFPSNFLKYLISGKSLPTIFHILLFFDIMNDIRKYFFSLFQMILKLRRTF